MTRGALIPLVAAMVLAAGCLRYQTVWSGAAYDDSGDFIWLAADEPLCGCLVLKNLSDRDIMLRSTLNDNELGSQLLPRATTLRVLFDWGGPNGRDVYQLEGFDATGKRVKLQELTTIEDNGWPWGVCTADQACDRGTLAMNMGENGRE
jgi:hypothetical protein